MLKSIRRYFDDKGLVEVDTPIMSAAGCVDRNIDAIACAGERWLHTSPEFAMKRLIASGLGSCYQICHVFRDEPPGPLHEPEFTMLEWYRVGFDLDALMQDVEDLLVALGIGKGPFVRRSYRAVLQGALGIDPFTASLSQLDGALRKHNVALDLAEAAEDHRDILLDAAMGFVAAPGLGLEEPSFVQDYPASQAALARLRASDPPVAERFELFWRGVELANGYHELSDAAEQAQRFARDHAWRCAHRKPTPPADTALVDALSAGLPECSGVALGLDRLLMLKLGLPTVAQSMPFDATRS